MKKEHDKENEDDDEEELVLIGFKQKEQDSCEEKTRR